MTPRKPQGDYEVGYGKPPRRTQFQKGQSGNPGGSRKKSTATAGDKVMHRSIVITEGGTRRRVTVEEALWLGLTQAGLRGDQTARATALKLRERQNGTTRKTASISEAEPPQVVPSIVVKKYADAALEALGVFTRIDGESRISNWVVEAALVHMGLDVAAYAELWIYAREVENPAVLEVLRPPES
jgi:hypothetical protein